MTTRPEITFREHTELRIGKDGELLGKWDAIPLQPVTGPRRERPSNRAILTIEEIVLGDGRANGLNPHEHYFTYKTLGQHPGGGGNRYHGYFTLAEAQAAVQKWAKRVYEVEAR